MGNLEDEIKRDGVTLIDCNDGQFDVLVWFHPVELYDGQAGVYWYDLDTDDTEAVAKMVEGGEAIHCRIEEWKHEPWGEQQDRPSDNPTVAHRIHGPAFTLFEESTGEIVREEYFNNGYRHRPVSDGPALRGISHLTGVVYIEEYHVAGDCHNPHGPAVIERDPQTGEVVSEEYFIRGEKVQPFSPSLPSQPTP